MASILCCRPTYPKRMWSAPDASPNRWSSVVHNNQCMFNTHFAQGSAARCCSFLETGGCRAEVFQIGRHSLCTMILRCLMVYISGTLKLYIDDRYFKIQDYVEGRPDREAQDAIYYIPFKSYMSNYPPCFCTDQDWASTEAGLHRCLSSWILSSYTRTHLARSGVAAFFEFPIASIPLTGGLTPTLRSWRNSSVKSTRTVRCQKSP